MLELPHPSDLWGGYCLEEEQFIEAWDAEVGWADACMCASVLRLGTQRCVLGGRVCANVRP